MAAKAKNQKKNQWWILGASIAVVCAVVGYTVYLYHWEVKDTTNQLVVFDVQRLADTLNTINDQCGIISFDYPKNQINFLNVIDFKGSEIGTMNLAYPDKWQGPYLDDNPIIQGKYYIVAVTKKGHFVVPPDGVELSEGKIIGKDIVINEDTDVIALTKDPEGLQYNGKPLAAQIKVSG